MAKWRPADQCCLGVKVEDCPLEECPGNEQVARTIVRDREILRLRLDGRAVKEIAALVHCSIRTVHHALGRCKSRLTVPAGRP